MRNRTVSIETELTLVTEELCRVIAGADRWQTCLEAWKALMTARRIAESSIAERATPQGGNSCLDDE